ncbi:MAG TPA: UdgX family uracil-DNA binding protein [Sandaracinaceae bacterium]
MAPRKERSAADFVPPGARTIEALRRAAQDCRGCDLYRNATQAVMGEGPRHARVMLIGEMPGDQEDREGRPFVGPAGRELASALESAGIHPGEAYVTNVVKHFKFAPRGKRRLHRKPTVAEQQACMPWLEREIEIVRPEVMVLLGATAARAILGPQFRITRERGVIVERPGRPAALATWHPSAILRQAEREDRARMRNELVADLEVAQRYLRARAHALGAVAR